MRITATTLGGLARLEFSVAMGALTAIPEFQSEAQQALTSAASSITAAYGQLVCEAKGDDEVVLSETYRFEGYNFLALHLILRTSAANELKARERMRSEIAHELVWEWLKDFIERHNVDPYSSRPSILKTLAA